MITFDVDKVKPAAAVLSSSTYGEKHRSLFFEEGFAKFGVKTGTVEAYRLNIAHNEVALSTPKQNWFLETCLKAYNDHTPLVLGPDEVWIAMMQAVSKHIELNEEDCRKVLVDFEGKKLLTVRADDLVKGSPNNDWPRVFGSFGDMMEEFIGKKRDLFDPTFSTTGDVEQAAIRVQMMAALSPFFDYKVETRCGIPQVTLLGEVDDWSGILSRVNALSEFYPKWAHEPMQYVAAEFVKASAGKNSPEFWQNFVKIHNQSGASPVSGFINAFFPYVDRKRKNPIMTKEGAFFVNQVLHGRGPCKSDIPSSVGAVPLLWQYYDTKFDMKLCTGIFGMAIDRSVHKNGALRPVIGWALGEAKKEKSNDK